jgi:diguanylate cyclase (GGDEF)-like protein/PAS domain S-box-containing protein
VPSTMISGDDDPNIPVSKWVKLNHPQDNMTPEHLGDSVMSATDAQLREADLTDLVENSQDAIWSIDRCYRAVVFNANFKQQFLGLWGVEPTPGMNLVTCLPIDLRKQWAEHYNRALRGDRFIVKMQFGRVDNVLERQEREVSFNPIVGNEGKPKGVAMFAQFRPVETMHQDQETGQQSEAALQHAKEQLQAILDAVPGCVSWFSSDLKYLGINRYLAATFKVRPEDFVDRELGFMKSSPGFSEFVQEFMSSSLTEGSVEIWAQVDDSIRDYLLVAQKYARNKAAVIVGIDITATKRDEVIRHQFEQDLRESQERYALAVQGANDGLWDWNLKTNEIYFSTRWKNMLGYEEIEIGSSTSEWFSRIHPEELNWFQAQLTAHLEGRTLHFEIEHRMCHKDGRYRWMLSRGLAVRDQNQKACRMAGSQTDITERKRAEEQLLHDALHDGLTGFSNRALFMDRLKQAIERTKRHYDARFAVLFLDLDRFKVVNDSLGHSIGDQLLIAIARRLESCLDVGDTIARLGGDEFAILLEGITDLNDAIQLAEQIHLKLYAPFNMDGQEVFTTVSIGIAPSEIGNDCLLGDRPVDHAEDLLRNAHTAMYQAKALGRARHALFDSTMRDRAVILLQVETDLRRALIGGKAATLLQEFQLYYQPVVSLKTGRISGFEALVRWLHPERGLISPAEFIPLAEDTGLIVPLGQWVLTKACQQLWMWQQQFPDQQVLSVSINLSTKQFAQADLVEQVQQTLRQTAIESELKLNLQLEITESAIMENPDAATTLLKKLKSLGVKLLIDDFGTGYSSLSHLHRFPFDTVKIDQSFISRINSSDESSEIIRAIVMLAHNLGMNVVAEGVETIEQMMQLRALGVEYGQGYFFAKPLTHTAAEQLLASEANSIDVDWIDRSSC